MFLPHRKSSTQRLYEDLASEAAGVPMTLPPFFFFFFSCYVMLIQPVTSVTPRRTPTDSERDFGNGLNHYPHFTSFPFPISSRVLSQLLIHNLPSLLPYPRIVTAASAAELLPSINM
jgi:hypothetical protein